MRSGLLYLTKGLIGRTFYCFPQHPERIQIEVTNRCNYTCGMCPRDTFHLPESDIPFDLFKKIIDKIDPRYTITLTGWGEPLLHPRLIDMIAYTKRRGHRVGVTTNGLLLATYSERFVDMSLDKLTISLDNIEEDLPVTDAHPANRVVQNNIQSLISYRNDAVLPVITVQITMHNKQQCLNTVNFAGTIGADRVYLVRLNIPFGKSSFKRPTMQEELEIYREAETLAKKYGLQVDSNYTAFNNSVFRLLYKQLRPFLYRFDKYCSKPYDYLYINIEGKVTPCCDLPRHEVGNILKQDLGDIWKSENIQYFRKHQNDICGTCDALRLKHLN
ncbi:MAG: radical SAM protein [Candidatus Brocadiaceae bacterium]|nr:radical SAM protein [Candidatus Brocadiaceae bacterium]